MGEMNILISTDMEGINGINKYSQLKQSNKQEYKKSCELLMEELNFVINICVENNANKIYVIDGHSKGENIIKSMLDNRAVFIKKEKLSMMEGIEKNIDFIIFLGYHGKSGEQNSFAAHTYSSMLIDNIIVNGLEMSEGEINALIGKHFGAKTIFISGTDKAIEQLNVKNIAKVEEKKSIYWDVAKSYFRDSVLKEIKTKLNWALQNNKEIGFIETSNQEVIMKVEFKHPFLIERVKEKNGSKDILIKNNIFEAFKRFIEIYREAQSKYKEFYG